MKDIGFVKKSIYGVAIGLLLSVSVYSHPANAGWFDWLLPPKHQPIVNDVYDRNDPVHIQMEREGAAQRRLVEEGLSKIDQENQDKFNKMEKSYDDYFNTHRDYTPSGP